MFEHVGCVVKAEEMKAWLLKCDNCCVKAMPVGFVRQSYIILKLKQDDFAGDIKCSVTQKTEKNDSNKI